MGRRRGWGRGRGREEREEGGGREREPSVPGLVPRVPSSLPERERRLPLWKPGITGGKKASFTRQSLQIGGEGEAGASEAQGAAHRGPRPNENGRLEGGAEVPWEFSLRAPPVPCPVPIPNSIEELASVSVPQCACKLLECGGSHAPQGGLRGLEDGAGTTLS